MTISVIIPSRAESGPLDSVIKALPEANIIRFDSTGMSPAVAMAQALPYFTAMYRNANTTRVVCLGDRYETLAAALAAMFVGVRVAHIHGGETTTGAFDDAFRHSITHLAEQSGGLHFVATGDAGDRVACLLGGTDGCWGPGYDGDDGMHIHLVGAPGLDGIEQGSARRNQEVILATFHPETRAPDYGLGACQAMLQTLDSFGDYKVIFTGVNNDPGAVEIREKIALYCKHDDDEIVENISHAEYIALMQSAALVIGNSSAGIIESPWVGCPSVNIGLRQNGRPRASSVFQWNVGDEQPLSEIIVKALGFVGYANPVYTGGPVGERIATILRQGESK